MCNKKVLLIGPYPPPYGGVSTHIKRLIELLNNDFKIIVIDESKKNKLNILNIRSLKFLSYLSLIKSSDIIHIHSGHYFLRLIHFAAGKFYRKKIIFTIHSYTLNTKGFLERNIDKFIFKNSYKVVCVNEKIYNMFSLANSYVKEAFLPPILNEEDPLPEIIKEWLERKKNDGFFISCANASRLDIYNNQDLYGLDLCIEVAKYCKQNNIKIAYVFIVSDKNGALAIEKYYKLIKDYQLEDLFFIYTSSLSFIKLIVESDIILRPTNTDADALTVREGLYYGKRVIASDVIKRPVNTWLFKNRDIDSLYEKILEVYDDLKSKNNLIESSNQSDASGYIKFYKHVLYN